MIYALILFAITYVLMLAFSKYRPVIALCSAVVFMVSGMLPADQIFSSIDFNVIMMIAGTMGLVQLFIDSRMPARLADLVMERVGTVQAAAVALALFAGIISAFVDNVATVLMVAPVALEICRKLKTNPVPFDMSFLDFFFYKGKPGMFFAVELGALISAAILAFIFRKEKGRIERNSTPTPVNDYVPSFLLLGTIVLLIAASFIPEKPSITNGLICLIMLAIGLVYNFFKKKNLDAITGPLKAIDFETIGILVGLFLIIGGISNMGVIDAAANLLAHLGGGNVFILYTIIVWASVLISAFIDNIPYTATMLPVVTGLAANLGIDPTLLYFGLLSGATLGGNITPIGASANITGIGILRKEGYEVKTSDFTRIGIPFTLAAVIPAYIYLWVFFH